MTQIRTVSKEALDRLQTLAKPTADNFMDLIRAIGGMPLKKLHPLYTELFGDEPMVEVTNGEGDDATSEIVLSPNRLQLVRLCQIGVQYLFYVHVTPSGELPEAVAGPTESAFEEELTASSTRKGGKRVSRGPTIKNLVLGLLAGTEQTYTDPETGEETIGMVAPSNDEIFAAVAEKFPDSKFDKTHLAWYLTQYRKGRFEKDGYGGETGKPLAVLTRDLNRAADKAEREAEKAKKAAEKAAKAETKSAEIPVPPANQPDPLADFDEDGDQVIEDEAAVQ